MLHATPAPSSSRVRAQTQGARWTAWWQVSRSTTLAALAASLLAYSRCQTFGCHCQRIVTSTDDKGRRSLDFGQPLPTITLNGALPFVSLVYLTLPPRALAIQLVTLGQQLLAQRLHLRRATLLTLRFCLCRSLLLHLTLHRTSQPQQLPCAPRCPSVWASCPRVPVTIRSTICPTDRRW